jgi:hypothetical protein
VVDEQAIIEDAKENVKEMSDRDLLEEIYITQQIIYQEIVDDLKLRTARIMRELGLEP